MAATFQRVDKQLNHANAARKLKRRWMKSALGAPRGSPLDFAEAATGRNWEGKKSKFLRYRVGINPIAEDRESEKMITPTPARKAELLKDFFSNKMRVIDSCWAAEIEAMKIGADHPTPAWSKHLQKLVNKKMFESVPLGARRDEAIKAYRQRWVAGMKAKSNAYKQILAQMSSAAAKGDAMDAYLRKFHMFLRGQPAPQDQAKLAKLGLNKTFTPLTHYSEVDEYLRAFSKIRADYYKDLALLKMRGPGNTLKEIEIYYKYIIDGNDMDKIERNLWEWLEGGKLTKNAERTIELKPEETLSGRLQADFPVGAPPTAPTAAAAAAAGGGYVVGAAPPSPRTNQERERINRLEDMKRMQQQAQADAAAATRAIAEGDDEDEVSLNRKRLVITNNELPYVRRFVPPLPPPSAAAPEPKPEPPEEEEEEVTVPVAYDLELPTNLKRSADAADDSRKRPAIAPEPPFVPPPALPPAPVAASPEPEPSSVAKALAEASEPVPAPLPPVPEPTPPEPAQQQQQQRQEVATPAADDPELPTNLKRGADIVDVESTDRARKLARAQELIKSLEKEEEEEEEQLDEDKREQVVEDMATAIEETQEKARANIRAAIKRRKELLKQQIASHRKVKATLERKRIEQKEKEDEERFGMRERLHMLAHPTARQQELNRQEMELLREEEASCWDAEEEAPEQEDEELIEELAEVLEEMPAATVLTKRQMEEQEDDEYRARLLEQLGDNDNNESQTKGQALSELMRKQPGTLLGDLNAILAAVEKGEITPEQGEKLTKERENQEHQRAKRPKKQEEEETEKSAWYKVVNHRASVERRKYLSQLIANKRKVKKLQAESAAALAGLAALPPPLEPASPPPAKEKRRITPTLVSGPPAPAAEAGKKKRKLPASLTVPMKPPRKFEKYPDETKEERKYHKEQDLIRKLKKRAAKKHNNE